MFTQSHATPAFVLVRLVGLLLLAACTAPSAPTMATATSKPMPDATAAVEFVLEIKGDPNPLYRPGGIAVDEQGHLYVADGGNDRIQVFDSNGDFLKMWGGRGNGDGEFKTSDSPGHAFGAVEVDEQGNVYVVDTFNHRIQKFTRDGRFLTKWGGRGNADGQFERPIGIAIDSQGNVYVVDDIRNDIQKFDGQGRFLTKFAGPGTGDGQLANTGLIAVDRQGNIFVADHGNHRVQKFDSLGKFLARWGTRGTADGQFSDPVGIALDGEGNVFVVEEVNNRVQKFDANGKFLLKWGSGGSGEGQLDSPFDAAVDRQGNVYVSDYYNDRVLKFRQR